MSAPSTVRVPASRAGQHREGGQAAVEVALLLPVLVVLALAAVQVGLVVRAQVLVTHAAREAARAAAVDADPAAPGRAARAASPLDPEHLLVAVDGRDAAGSRARVVVTYGLATDVPLVGRLLPDLTLRASATMRVE